MKYNFTDNIKFCCGNKKIITVLSMFLFLFYQNLSAQDYLYTDYYFLIHKKKSEVIIKNGLRNGVQTFWRINGNRHIEATYVNDTLHGKIVEWYNNGQIKYIGYYKNGLMHDKWSYYYNNGKPKAQEYYVDEIAFDYWYLWYRNGNLKEKSFYIDGVLEGKWQIWYRNGKLKEEGFVKDGLKHGIWFEYYYNGQKRMKIEYNHGDIVKPPKRWWSTGKPDDHFVLPLPDIIEDEDDEDADY